MTIGRARAENELMIIVKLALGSVKDFVDSSRATGERIGSKSELMTISS